MQQLNDVTMQQSEISAWHYATRKPVLVRCENGKIVAIEKPSETPTENIWIAPALFDVQVNGYGGIDYQQDDLTTEQLRSSVRQLLRDGCSKILLTLITDEWPRLVRRLQYIKALRDADPELGQAIAGWHIEGPFLSDKAGFHGAHNPGFMCDPTAQHIEELRKITGNDPLLLTLSPERTGAIDAIHLATQLGIKVSLGHTNASAEVLSKAVAAGAVGFTHLGNGCPRELDRHDNILWRVFETSGLIVGIIPDAIHVSAAPFRLMHRVLNSIYYTTDAMSAAGAGPGIYKLATMELEVAEDQIVRMPGKTNFAGSALRPIDGIFRAAEMLNKPWQSIWTNFTEAPARLMDLRPNLLEVGQNADLCVLQFEEGTQKLQSLSVLSN